MISSSFGLKETMSTAAMSMGVSTVSQLDEEWDTFGVGNDADDHAMFGGRDGRNAVGTKYKHNNEAIISSSTDDDWESFCANDSGSGGVSGSEAAGETWKTQLAAQPMKRLSAQRFTYLPKLKLPTSITLSR